LAPTVSASVARRAAAGPTQTPLGWRLLKVKARQIISNKKGEERYAISITDL
jgi:hypothetical protein